MSCYSSDAKSRASKKAKAVIEDLRKSLEAKKVLKPEQESVPKQASPPWWAL